MTHENGLEAPPEKAGDPPASSIEEKGNQASPPSRWRSIRSQAKKLQDKAAALVAESPKVRSSLKKTAGHALALGRKVKDSTSRAARRAQESSPAARELVSQAADQARDLGRKAKESALEAATRARESELLNRTAERVAELGEQAKESTLRAASHARESAPRAGAVLAEAGSRLRRAAIELRRSEEQAQQASSDESACSTAPATLPGLDLARPQTTTLATPPLSSQEALDLHHLRLLSYFHYTAAGLLGFVFLLAIPTTLLGAAFSVVGTLLAHGVAGLALGCFLGLVYNPLMPILLVVAGRNLVQQRKYAFCVAIATLSCLAFPLGTVVGVATLLVLRRPTVRRAFRQVAAVAALPPPEDTTAAELTRTE